METELWTALVIIAFFLGCAFGASVAVVVIRQIRKMEVNE